jgi:hypothetical protein
MSNEAVINIGVPQGSVLGPLLFNIFVNDISQHVYTGVANLYADDTLIYTTGTNVQEVTNNLPKCIDNVMLWYNKNNIVINVEKSTCMLVSSKFFANKNKESLKIKINDTYLKETKCIKYLGVDIDNVLNWDQQINNLSRKLCIKISQFQRMSKLLSKEVLLMIYNSAIQPCFDYGVTIWGTTNDLNLSKLQRLQNFVARIIQNNFDYINVRGIDLVKSIGWMSVKDRFKYFQHLLLFKSVHGKAPDYLCNNIVFNIEINKYETRNHPLDLYTDIPKNEISKKKLFYRGVIDWNKLPNVIKDTSNTDTFKKMLKLYLKSSQ